GATTASVSSATARRLNATRPSTSLGRPSRTEHRDRHLSRVGAGLTTTGCLITHHQTLSTESGQFHTRGTRTAKDVAESLGVAENMLYAWRRQYEDVTAQVREERGESPEEELKRLRREN